MFHPLSKATSMISASTECRNTRRGGVSSVPVSSQRAVRWRGASHITSASSDGNSLNRLTRGPFWHPAAHLRPHLSAGGPQRLPIRPADNEGVGLFPFPGSESSAVVDLTGASDAVLQSRIRELQSDEVEESEVAPTPAMRTQVLAFALPALGSVLADPLMSLVDTAAVGQFSLLHLAALAPNTSIFNLFFQVFTFLGITTTSLIANRCGDFTSLSEKGGEARRASASEILGHAMVLAVCCGLACCSVMFAAGPAMLSAVGASPETLEPALAYLRIRALASPAVMVANVAQGALLAQKDSWTPLKVLLASGALNLLLDYALVIQAGWGITGAAVATALAQYVAAGFLVNYLVRGGSRGQLLRLGWHGLPSTSTLRPFWEMANALLSRTLFTMLAYTSLSTVAVGMGTIQAAAHQVGLQLFWFLSEAPQCLSVSAQSLIARERGTPARAREIVHTLLQLAVVFGLLMATLFGMAVTHAGWMFSGDALVRATLTGLAGPGAASLMLCAVVMVFDGASIGMGRFRHLPLCNLGGLLVTLALLALANSCGAGLSGTWCCLLGFFGARGALHLQHHRHEWEHGLFGRGELKPSVAFAAHNA